MATVVRSKWFRKSASSGELSRKRSYDDYDTTIGTTANNGSGNESPLQACLEWIAEHSAPTECCALRSCVALAHERPYANYATTKRTFREYQAIDLVALAEWARTPLEQRCAHEVIDERCKIYVDVDIDTNVNGSLDCETLCSRLVATLLARVQRRFAGVRAHPCVLDASKPGKFSRHIIVELSAPNICIDDTVSDDNDDDVEMSLSTSSTASSSSNDGDPGCRLMPAMFETKRDCAAFVAAAIVEASLDSCLYRMERDERVGPLPLHDLSVYRTNSCLRTYGSTKYDEPARPLRLVGSSEPLRRLDVATLRRSLVSLHSLIGSDDDTGDWLPLSANDEERASLARLEAVASVIGARRQTPPAHLVHSRERRSPSPYTAASQTLRELVESIDVIHAATIVDVASFGGDEGKVRVRCQSRECSIKGAPAHRSSNIYFVVDLTSQRYRQQCYSPYCASRLASVAWQPLPAAAAAAARHYIAVEWRGGRTYSDRVLAAALL